MGLGGAGTHAVDAGLEVIEDGFNGVDQVTVAGGDEGTEVVGEDRAEDGGGEFEGEGFGEGLGDFAAGFNVAVEVGGFVEGGDGFEAGFALFLFDFVDAAGQGAGAVEKFAAEGGKV